MPSSRHAPCRLLCKMALGNEAPGWYPDSWVLVIRMEKWGDDSIFPAATISQSQSWGRRERLLGRACAPIPHLTIFESDEKTERDGT